MSTYKVNFQNNTHSNVNALILVGEQGQQASFLGGYYLAWLSAGCLTGKNTKFSWTSQYGFTWAKSGVLKPGSNFHPVKIEMCDPYNKNMILFTGVDMQQLTTGGNPGDLVLRTSSTIVPSTTSIGFSLGGYPAWAVQAQPNMNYIVQPRPVYYVAIGNFLRGEALANDAITNYVAIRFQGNVTSLNVTLNADNTWTVENGQ